MVHALRFASLLAVGSQHSPRRQGPVPLKMSSLPGALSEAIVLFRNGSPSQTVCFTTNRTPDKGIEPLTSGLKVPRSTGWANRAQAFTGWKTYIKDMKFEKQWDGRESKVIRFVNRHYFNELVFNAKTEIFQFLGLDWWEKGFICHYSIFKIKESSVH